MNVFEKLTEARLFFQNANVKMSGKNAFANYKYYELSDILPAINRAAKEIGFCCVVRFGKEEATLDFVNSEKADERIVFTSPMSTASLKGCHEVQNLGAVESYVRRYLYLTAFEIVESDALDATMNPQAAPSSGAAKSAPARKAESPRPAASKAAAAPSNSAPKPHAEEPRLTNEQMQAEIQALLTALYPDGLRVFSEAEKKEYWKRFTKSPMAVIWHVRTELESRRGKWRESAREKKEAEELREFEDDIPF